MEIAKLHDSFAVKVRFFTATHRAVGTDVMRSWRKPTVERA